MNDFPIIFSGKLGLFNKRKFELQLKDEAKPRYLKPRVVPYALKELVEQEINRLVDESIIQTVEYGKPIVPILKPDGSIHLCGDYKVTINGMLHIGRHPIPRVNELFLALRGGQQFSKLDPSQAYQQFKLDEKSKNVVTISTQNGMFRPNRLPFGLASGQGKFNGKLNKYYVD